MFKQIAIVGWSVGIFILGAFAFAVGDHAGALQIKGEIPIADLGQLAATVFLALYIPLAIDKRKDTRKRIQDLLVEQVKSLTGAVSDVRLLLTKCATEDKTTNQNRLAIKAGFLTANHRMTALELAVAEENRPRCKKALEDVRDAYDNYFDAVTDGALYGSGNADWALWRKQEVRYSDLQKATTNLLRLMY